MTEAKPKDSRAGVLVRQPGGFRAFVPQPLPPAPRSVKRSTVIEPPTREESWKPRRQVAFAGSCLVSWGFLQDQR